MSSAYLETSTTQPAHVAYMHALARHAGLAMAPPATCPTAPPTRCRALIVLGLCMGITGLVIGFCISGGWAGAFPVHRNIGLASIILGAFQARRQC